MYILCLPLSDNSSISEEDAAVTEDCGFFFNRGPEVRAEKSQSGSRVGFFLKKGVGQ